MLANSCPDNFSLNLRVAALRNKRFPCFARSNEKRSIKDREWSAMAQAIGPVTAVRLFVTGSHALSDSRIVSRATRQSEVDVAVIESLKTIGNTRPHVPSLRTSLWSSSIETVERQPAQRQLLQGDAGLSPAAKACKPKPVTMAMCNASMRSMLNLRSGTRIVRKHQAGKR